MAVEKDDTRAQRMTHDLIAAVFTGSREGVDRVKQLSDVTTQQQIDEGYRQEAAQRYRIEAAAFRNCPFHTDGIKPRRARFVEEGTPTAVTSRARFHETDARETDPSLTHAVVTLDAGNTS